MITFGVVRAFPFPAARTWPVIGNFARLPDWFPGIVEFSAQGTHTGATRRIVIAPFPPVTHRLAVQDDQAMFTRYQVIDGPGLSESTGFVVTIRVSARGDNACVIDWQARLAQRPSLVPAGGEAAFAARTEASYQRALDHFAGTLAADTV